MTEEAENGVVTLAILTSRVDALCLADMLNAEGIAVHIGGYHHATTQGISVALGGFRIWVPTSQYAQASELIREVGAHQNWTFSYGVQKAVLRLLAAYLLPAAWIGLAGVAAGWIPLKFLAPLPLLALEVPVNPQGRGDYFLAPPSA